MQGFLDGSGPGAFSFRQLSQFSRHFASQMWTRGGGREADANTSPCPRKPSQWLQWPLQHGSICFGPRARPGNGKQK